jgi:hypothetical protein
MKAPLTRILDCVQYRTDLDENDFDREMSFSKSKTLANQVILCGAPLKVIHSRFCVTMPLSDAKPPDIRLSWRHRTDGSP